MSQTKVTLENARVRISEVIYDPGIPRESYVRSTAQAIIFLDDCRYERIDAGTGERAARERKQGEAIWHDRGEQAPVLINTGSIPYRTLLIEFKE